MSWVTVPKIWALMKCTYKNLFTSIPISWLFWPITVVVKWRIKSIFSNNSRILICLEVILFFFILNTLSYLLIQSFLMNPSPIALPFDPLMRKQIRIQWDETIGKLRHAYEMVDHDIIYRPSHPKSIIVKHYLTNIKSWITH